MKVYIHIFKAFLHFQSLVATSSCSNINLTQEKGKKGKKIKKKEINKDKNHLYTYIMPNPLLKKIYL